MTDAELIARLRDWQEHDEGKINDAREEAADRIEALVKQVRESALQELASLGQAQEAYEAQKAAEAERDEADNALVDRYRDPKSGIFKFPSDVAAIIRRLDAAEAEVEKLRGALRDLIDHTHNCEKELTEKLHGADFCGESLPLTNARAAITEEHK